MTLTHHSMVRLGKGQAIVGGWSNADTLAKIYFMTCSNRNCIISLLDRELSVPKRYFVILRNYFLPPVMHPEIVSGMGIATKYAFGIESSLSSNDIMQFLLEQVMK